MSRSLWSWQCPECGAELGIVERGVLWPKPGLVTRTDRSGALLVACASVSDDGQACQGVRTWSARGRAPQTRSCLVQSDLDATSLLAARRG